MILFFFIVLIVLLVGSIWLNVIVIRKNLELFDQRERLVDTIEESLDKLDECYTRISYAAEIPVFSDEPIVRDLLNDIKRAKNAVLSIASQIIVYGEEKDAAGD
jgi:biopolymer transport protein ExbB/TolQ